MTRTMLSRPVARAVQDGIISPATAVLDYGCGRGGDVRRLERLGVQCRGYDPVYRPEPVRQPADVVNLGYVLNVIEDPTERQETLDRAWTLTSRVLIVPGPL